MLYYNREMPYYAQQIFQKVAFVKEKLALLKSIFTSKSSDKEALEAVIFFGKQVEHFPKNALIKENLVQGCQSELYLTHTYKDGKIHFYIHSEALISKGLAALLIHLYNDESPTVLFTYPPSLFAEFPVLQKISMNRQIGIQNLFLMMQKIAAKYI